MADLFNQVNNGAVFSNDRKYRFVLWRIWNNALPKVMFIGLNPSTANEYDDDKTIIRVKQIANHLGYGGIYMLNCFPYISTDPDDLREFGNIDMNDYWIHRIGNDSKVKSVIFSWGNFNIVKEKKRDIQLFKMFPDAEALIINKDGSPRHPLYVPTKTIPVPYKNSKPGLE